MPGELSKCFKNFKDTVKMFLEFGRCFSVCVGIVPKCFKMCPDTFKICSGFFKICSVVFKICSGFFKIVRSTEWRVSVGYDVVHIL